MNITPYDVDAMRDCVQSGELGQLGAVAIDTVGLGAVLDLACSMWQWRQSGNLELRRIASGWVNEHAALKVAWLGLISPGSPPTAEPFETLQYEIQPIRAAQAFSELLWTQFFARFRSVLRKHGFSVSLSLALAGAFGEMADNVRQHSGATLDTPARGLAGYHVQDNWAHFAVADVGRGVRASLRTNARWADIDSESEALQLAICQGATSRTSTETGSGFRTVHTAMADYNGTLRFRSGDSVLTLEGCESHREVSVRDSSALCGFQLSVTCRLASDSADYYIDALDTRRNR